MEKGKYFSKEKLEQGLNRENSIVIGKYTQILGDKENKQVNIL
jgi:hypothetical protein